LPQPAAKRVRNGSSEADSGDASQADVGATFVCAHCGAPMIIVQAFLREQAIRAPPVAKIHHERQNLDMVKQ